MKFTPLESAGWMDARARLHNFGRGTGFCGMGDGRGTAEELSARRGYCKHLGRGVICTKMGGVTRGGDRVQSNASGGGDSSGVLASAADVGIAVREVSILSRVWRYRRTT